MKPGELTIASNAGERFDIPEHDAALPSTGRRLAWARHLVVGKHPLLGRVLANRIWLHHFGRGIVETPSEFGVLGTRPTHPELLDWLADELPRQGWSLKRMHKLLMTSSVYRQSSRRLDANSADTDGALYSRFSVRRLEAETVRDRMLATCGRLDRKQFGPPVEIMEDFAGQVHVKDDSARRSVYVQVRRSKPVSLLAAFDAPVMAVNCDRRSPSTVAPQSLMLMNGEFTLKQAEHLAKRLRTDSLGDFDREVTAPVNQSITQSSIGLAIRLQGFVDECDDGLEPEPEGNRRAVPTARPLDGVSLAGRNRIARRVGGLGVAKCFWRSCRRRSTACRYPPLDGFKKRVHLDQRQDVDDILQNPETEFVQESSQAGKWSFRKMVHTRPTASRRMLTGSKSNFPGEHQLGDFVTDCVESVNSDSFEWAVNLRLIDAVGTEVDRWDSVANFHGPMVKLTTEQIACAWRLAYCRPITSDELEFACQFLEQQLTTLKLNGVKGDHELIALSSLCPTALLSSNEFLYLD